MKRLIPLLLLAGCSTLSNLEQSNLAKVTHADLQAAAAYADAHGYPARAAVWTAIDAQLTACNEAIGRAVAAQGGTQVKGLATAFEIAAEANGTGIPADVRLNCAPLPLIRFPALPNLP